MRKLLACDSYALELGPGGLSLGRVVAGVAQSLLGRFQVVAEGLGGRPILTTSEAALYALIDTADGGIELRYPAADGSGLLWTVHAHLSESGLLLWQSLRNQSAQVQTLTAFRLVAQPDDSCFLAGAGTKAGWQVFRTGYSSFTPSCSVDSRFRPSTPPHRAPSTTDAQV